MAVFVPVAFMGGVAGEWFRPFALTVATSVLVSLFISFTLDPMLSAYWGDPPDQAHRKRSKLGETLKRFNVWFDHQADRYAKRHRVGAPSSNLDGAHFLRGAGHRDRAAGDGGRLELPAAFGRRHGGCRGAHAVEREPRIRASQGGEGGGAGPRHPETVATNSTVNATGGRVYVDIGKSNKRARSAEKISEDLRERLKRLVGAEYVVLDDLNNGAQKPIQIQFYGPDSRRLMAITNDFMEAMKKIPGAVDVGLSEQEPKDELRIELDRGLANTLGISVNDAAQALRVAFAGVEVGDWVDPVGESRDVSVRLHPEDRVDASNIEHLPVAVGGSNMLVPLEQIANISMDKGPAQIQHLGGKRTITVSANAQGSSTGEVTHRRAEDRRRHPVPGWLWSCSLGGASRDQEEIFSEMFAALLMGIAVMYLVLVMQFGSFTAPIPVMISLPLSLIGVVSALLDHAGHAQSHELHRHHHADGPRGEERHPAAGLRAQGRSARRRPRRSADARRTRASAADPHDHVRADRRHDAGGHRHGRGR